MDSYNRAAASMVVKRISAFLAGICLVFPAGAAVADCRAFPFSVWQPMAERMVFQPRTLLSDFPGGGVRLTNRVAIIGSSSRAGLTSLLQTTPLASSQQRRAIAQGLVAAARLCDSHFPVEARRIELAVTRSNDMELRREFGTAFQSQFSLDAELRSQQLGQSVEQEAARNRSSANSGLFNPRSTSAVQGVRPIGPVRTPQ